MANGRSQRWRNRTVGYADVDPSQLVPSDLNFRRHPGEQQNALTGLIDELGFIDPVLVQAGTDRVIDGHLRVELAMRSGQPTIPVQYVDLTDDEANLALATIDPVSAMAYHDAANLAELLGLIDTDNADIQALLDSLEPEVEIVEGGLTDPDNVPSVPDEPITKPGDLWLLGRHRLLCGDATVVTDVSRLMGDEKADMVFTDPPYNVGYKYATYDDTKLQAEYVQLLRDAIPLDVPAIVNNGNTKIEEMALAFGRPYHVGVWLKTNAMSPSAISSFSVWEPVYFYGKFKRRPGNDLFDYPISNQPDTGDHPCPKPLRMCVDLVDQFCEGDYVYDPFGGSGSTLIACEQTNRRAALMEIDPHYCDVIVKRWEVFTGKTAVLADHAMAAD